jgi:hypothetical protein
MTDFHSRIILFNHTRHQRSTFYDPKTSLLKLERRCSCTSAEIHILMGEIRKATHGSTNTMISLETATSMPKLVGSQWEGSPFIQNPTFKPDVLGLNDTNKTVSKLCKQGTQLKPFLPPFHGGHNKLTCHSITNVNNNNNSRPSRAMMTTVSVLCWCKS